VTMKLRLFVVALVIAALALAAVGVALAAGRRVAAACGGS
jgi:hypothetical protein